VIPHELPLSPEPLPSPVLDSHTHLDIVSAERGSAETTWSVPDQIAAAAAVGVDRLVQVGVDVDSSRGPLRWPHPNRRCSPPWRCT
jgi:TatD DNase family protein